MASVAFFTFEIKLEKLSQISCSICESYLSCFKKRKSQHFVRKKNFFDLFFSLGIQYCVWAKYFFFQKIFCIRFFWNWFWEFIVIPIWILYYFSLSETLILPWISAFNSLPSCVVFWTKFITASLSLRFSLVYLLL